MEYTISTLFPINILLKASMELISKQSLVAFGKSSKVFDIKLYVLSIGPLAFAGVVT